mgnify:CR=1 FL=1
MKLSPQEVQHIAELAKLSLSPEETVLFAEQLSEILDYAEMLKRLDTAAIPPTAQAIPLQNVARLDAVRPSLPPAVALQNAPRREDDYFVVTAILD